MCYLFNSNQGQPARGADANWMELSFQGITGRNFLTSHSHSWSYRAETRTFIFNQPGPLFSINTELPLIYTFLITLPYRPQRAHGEARDLEWSRGPRSLRGMTGAAILTNVGNKYLMLKEKVDILTNQYSFT